MRDEELEKEMEKRSKEENELQTKIKSRISSEEMELREKVLLAWNRHGEIFKDFKQCNCSSCHREIAEGVKLMKEITEKAKLVQIKKLLTPREYERFLPLYLYFKQTKTITTHPHGEDGQLLRF